MTNTWDAANRLQAGQNAKFKVQNYYDGTGNRVAEVSNGITTTFTLDIQGLPEVIQTGAGETTLHLPGVIVTESAAGEIRYLLGDGLGSVRQAVDELGTVVAYNEYDPYGNPYFRLPAPYAFTGEWWQDNLDLLYLRARWYAPATGTFLSVDPVESEPPYQYVGGRVVNSVDPSGMAPPNPQLNVCSVCDNFEANGYAEGVSSNYTIFFHSKIPEQWGKEIVYDFATMERSSFNYESEPMFKWSDPSGATYEPPSYNTNLGELARTWYFSTLHNFESTRDIKDEYEGRFLSFSVGGSTSLIELGGGYVRVWSPQNDVTGDGLYLVGGIGFSPLPWPISLSGGATNYTQEGYIYEYSSGLPNDRNVTKDDMQRMYHDIWSGRGETPSDVNALEFRGWAANDLLRTWNEHSIYFERFYGKCRNKRGKNNIRPDNLLLWR